MKVLIDIGHPAHVHFFRHPIRILKEYGHEVLVTSREKEFATTLLDQLGIPHKPLSALKKGGLLSLGKELIQRDIALYKVAREFKPDAMAAIGGVSIAHVSAISRIPSLVFYDTENATLQNAITYPLASSVFVPQCYEAWVPKHRHVRYQGYHELSYLHPNVFKPDKDIAVQNGLAPEGKTFFLRLVSWQASHDVGETGWNTQLLANLIEQLSLQGKILISSEMELAQPFQRYAYEGDLSQVHHVLAYCHAFIGESATMASECAVLGVPAIYAAETPRGYTNEQESRYDLVKNVRQLQWDTLKTTLEDILKQPQEHWHKAHQRLLDECIDVSAFVVECIETFPAPLKAYQAQLGH